MSKLADEIAAHAASTAPAVYTPFVSGRYEVKPGLKRFGSDFGNGAADQRVFQLDFDWPRYRAAKEAARAAGQRCFVTHEYPADVDAAARGFMIERLSREYPGISVPRDSTVDEMAMLLQEDIAVTMMRGGRQWLAMLHVCLPSHWDPRKKIGRTFSAVHEIVPGMHSVNQREGDFVRQMIDATDGLVRFVWGVQWGDELDRHPDVIVPPSERLFVRVERQTIWGLSEVGASLFTIRPYLIDGVEVRRRPVWRDALIAAIEGMSDASAEYKGLGGDRRRRVIDWLSSPV